MGSSGQGSSRLRISSSAPARSRRAATKTSGRMKRSPITATSTVMRELPADAGEVVPDRMHAPVRYLVDGEEGVVTPGEVGIGRLGIAQQRVDPGLTGR